MNLIDFGIYDQLNEDRNQLANKQDIKNVQSGMFLMQFEPAVILDIVLDDSHPLFKSGKIGTINVPNEFPPNYNNVDSKLNDLDYSNIGCALIRLCYSQKKVDKEELVYAFPLEYGITTLPLLNEVVGVVKYFNKYFYTTKVNTKNFANTSADFRYEPTYGNKVSNREFAKSDGSVKSFQGPDSKLTTIGGLGFEGALGRYFWFNKNIRNLRRFEGDSVIESRFGQSIRFSAYDSNRKNDEGFYTDYTGDGSINPYSQTLIGGGNPMILIRNRQRKLTPTINPREMNCGGYIEENVNDDGSSVHITCGKTISKFLTTCNKKYFSSNLPEEQPKYSPPGSTLFKYPTLDQDQIVINSDRIVLSSKSNETIHFSKKRYMVVTDSEYTVDAHDQIVLTTNTKTVINSPAIYLGEYNNTNEPALLGQTSVDWLYELCNWLIEHVHIDSEEGSTGAPENQSTLVNLQNTLSTLLSKRVFITGGGYAPGSNGGTIKGGTPPVKIDTANGNGVPGGWPGKNTRK